MFEKVLADLGVTESSVKTAISGLLNSNAQLKATVREIVGSGVEFKPAGTINGQEVFVKA